LFTDLNAIGEDVVPMTVLDKVMQVRGLLEGDRVSSGVTKYSKALRGACRVKTPRCLC
jgi:hypothetical protein